MTPLRSVDDTMDILSKTKYPHCLDFDVVTEDPHAPSRTSAFVASAIASMKKGACNHVFATCALPPQQFDLERPETLTGLSTLCQNYPEHLPTLPMLRPLRTGTSGLVDRFDEHEDALRAVAEHASIARIKTRIGPGHAQPDAAIEQYETLHRTAARLDAVLPKIVLHFPSRYLRLQQVTNLMAETVGRLMETLRRGERHFPVSLAIDIPAPGMQSNEPFDASASADAFERVLVAINNPDQEQRIVLHAGNAQYHLPRPGLISPKWNAYDAFQRIAFANNHPQIGASFGEFALASALEQEHAPHLAHVDNRLLSGMVGEGLLATYASVGKIQFPEAKDAPANLPNRGK